MQTIDYKANLVANTNRGPSDVIWADCPVLDFLENPSKGMYFFDDFIMTGNAVMSSAFQGSFGQWSAYGAAGALLADGALEGGVAKLGSDGANEGVTLNSGTGAFRMVTTSTLALNQKLWFEARFSRSSVATTDADYFMGLAIPALSSGLPRANYPITTTDDTLDATNGTFIGFHSTMTTGTRGGPTEVAVAFNLAGGTINYPTNLTTMMATTGQTVLAANTYVKLGMVFDPSAPVKRVTLPTARQTTGQLGRALIRFFVNGVEHPTFLTADDVQNATAAQAFPTGFMAPTLAVMNGAGTASTMNVDWVRVAQLANS
jgi:hypothetical protein